VKQPFKKHTSRH